jgi:hypothetical protein
MRKLKLLLSGFLLLTTFLASADEGMWLLPYIQQNNLKDMKAKGFKLTAEDLFSINKSSIKDAIVRFGRGCTGEIISSQGLVLTNHHCGYGAIQQHSTPANDYLKYGFWAMTREEEIPTPGLTVTFLVRIEDVTTKVKSALSETMDEELRNLAIRRISDSLSTKAVEGTHYSAFVRPFFGGNQFFLFVNEIFTDVRMVGAPPSSIGKYGADTDNWMWPRHTGDFSIFRVYANADNKPADYSPNNVPYKPKHHLPISLKGIEKGDFAMIMGYPGSTERYMTSWEVEETETITNANRAYIRGIRQEILLEDMLADDAVRIKYSSKYASSSNYWKYSIGQNQALKQLKVQDNKRNWESEFNSWVAGNAQRTEKYGNALNYIKSSVEERRELRNALEYMNETIFRGAEIVSFAARMEGFYSVLKEGKEANVTRRAEQLKASARDFYKNYNAPTDQKASAAMFKLFIKNVDPKFHPSIIDEIKEKYGNDLDAFMDDLFKTTIFVDSVKLWAFLQNPDTTTLLNDWAFRTAKSTNQKITSIFEEIKPKNLQYQKGHRQFVAGLLEKNQGRAMYPDANGTIRFTYGQVLDYYPKDAVHYRYYTTLKGVMEKEDPSNWEFVVPEKLKELYNKKDFGPYAMKNGEMPLAFLSNNDITGGNSGSPVLNAKGQLIGCAFDGNWEAMSGDIVFEPEYQRTISVDIRYVLFIIDKYAGAGHLVKEMTIVR